MSGVFTASALIAGCKEPSDSDRGRQSLLRVADGASRAEENAAQNPCTLLSAREAERYVGALGVSPFRASDGSDAPDTAGEECVYRGKDGRQLTVLADWMTGGTMEDVLEGAPKVADAGPWDRATWSPGGALFVYKADAQIRIELTAPKGRKNDALAIAREIVPRIGHPLSYGGPTVVGCDSYRQHTVHKPSGPPCRAHTLMEQLS
jgi:hypothetical protein